jgi:uncharacterized protein YjiS (DUF1127 family)
METTMHFDQEDQHGESPLGLYMKLRRKRGHHVAAILRDAPLRAIVACGRMMRAISIELVSRRHEQLLASLDDRALADIGVSRHEIPVLVRSAERHRRACRRAE